MSQSVSDTVFVDSRSQFANEQRHINRHVPSQKLPPSIPTSLPLFPEVRRLFLPDSINIGIDIEAAYTVWQEMARETEDDRDRQR